MVDLVTVLSGLAYLGLVGVILWQMFGDEIKAQLASLRKQSDEASGWLAWMRHIWSIQTEVNN